MRHGIMIWLIGYMIIRMQLSLCILNLGSYLAFLLLLTDSLAVFRI